MQRCALLIPILLCCTMVFARTIEVRRDGHVNSIRLAVDLAHNGDTILVHPGVYKEGNIIITRSIVLLGINYPVLDGEKKHESLTVSGRNITIRGFLFQNGGTSVMNDFASLKVIDASGVTIESNRILNAYFAIHISNATHCTVRNNFIRGIPSTEQTTGNGIHLWKCSNMTITGNRVSGHRDGIYFEFVTDSFIRNNLSEGNIRYGLHFMFSHNDTYTSNTFKNNGAGVAVMYSKKVVMESNHFEYNWGPSAYGILLKDISDSHIDKNNFYMNTVGIHMEGSSRILVRQNQFRQNGWAMRVQASCDDNEFLNNNFHGNTFDIGTNGSLSLNTFSNNYWDKYDGYDMNKDGIGDIPYHPVSMYSLIVENNPNTLFLLRSFIISLLDRAERAIPSLTPENLRDEKPSIRPNKL